VVSAREACRDLKTEGPSFLAMLPTCGVSASAEGVGQGAGLLTLTHLWGECQRQQSSGCRGLLSSNPHGRAAYLRSIHLVAPPPCLTLYLRLLVESCIRGRARAESPRAVLCPGM
jgi:hypothetical protein